MRRDSANFQRKIGIDFVCKLGGEDCLIADLAPHVNGYSPWTLIICVRVGDIIAHCAEEMGKGKPGNLTAHLFRHDIRVPEVEANPNARVYQLVHGLLNGAEAARNGWTRLIIGQRERIIAISEEGEEMPVRVGRTWSTAQRLMPSLQKLLTESRAAPQMLMKFGIQ